MFVVCAMQHWLASVTLQKRHCLPLGEL